MTSVMIQIGDKIISRELFDNHFICHLEKCKGNCCVYGDAGAPLEDDEASRLEENLEQLKAFLRHEGIEALEKKGAWQRDDDGEKVTPLVGDDECAYVVYEKGIARCGIENAYEEGAVPFRKPVSCHLYPIRATRLNQATALNYHRWGICEPARILGRKQGLPVFQFLKEPITRVYGKEFYRQLEIVYQEMIQPEKEKK
jgi:hypothetical protein